MIFFLSQMYDVKNSYVFNFHSKLTIKKRARVLEHTVDEYLK